VVDIDLVRVISFINRLVPELIYETFCFCLRFCKAIQERGRFLRDDEQQEEVVSVSPSTGSGATSTSDGSAVGDR